MTSILLRQNATGVRRRSLLIRLNAGERSPVAALTQCVSAKLIVEIRIDIEGIFSCLVNSGKCGTFRRAEEHLSRHSVVVGLYQFWHDGGMSPLALLGVAFDH